MKSRRNRSIYKAEKPVSTSRALLNKIGTLEAEPNLEVGAHLLHYKGGTYKVFGHGTHTETGEVVVIYQSDADNELHVRPRHMFSDAVEYEGNIVPRFQEVEKRPYGGTRTLLKDLPVDTRFYINNGHANARIILIDNNKHMLYTGSDLSEARLCTDDLYLDITIEEEST